MKKSKEKSDAQDLLRQKELEIQNKELQLKKKQAEIREKEEFLIESDRKLKEIQALSHLGFWEWDIKTGHVEWTSEVYKIFHLDPQKFTPNIDSILELSPWPEEKNRNNELIKKATESKSQGDYEQKFLLPDKSIGYYYSTFQGKYDENDNLISIIGTILDITDRKQAEEKLKESEEKYRSLVEGSLQGMVVALNNPIRIAYASSPMETISGYSPNEIESFGPEEIKELIHKDDREAFFKGFADRIAGKFVEPHKNYRLIRKDGSVCWIELFSTLIQYNNQPATQTVFLDITKRKQAEDALIKSRDLLHSIIENAPIRVFWKDIELRYLGCNKAFANDAGVSNPEYLIGKDDFQMGWREQAEAYRADDQLVINSGKPRINYEEPQTTPDGNTIWLSTSKVPLLDAKKNVIGILGVYEDITERKQAEKKLKESETLLRKVIDNTPNSIFIKDRDGYYILVNDKMAESHNTTPNEIVGTLDINLGKEFFTSKEKIEKFRTAEQEVIDNKQVLYIPEEEFTFLDGSKRWFQTTKIPISIKNNPNCVMSVAVDITERKLAEMELKAAKKNAEENEMKYRSMFNSMQEGVYLHSLVYDDSGKAINYRIIDANDISEKYLNIKKEDAIGKLATELYETEEAPLLDIYSKVALTGEPYQFEQYFEPMDKYFLISVFSSKKGDFTTVFLDISDIKKTEQALILAKEKAEKSEERFELAVNATQDGIFDWDLKSNEIYYSPSWKMMLGYQDNELANDFSVWETTTSPEDVKRSWEMQNDLINKKRDSFEIEFKMKHKKGHWVDILSRAKAIFDDSGKAIRIVGTHIDITDRKKAEEAIAKSNDLLTSVIKQAPFAIHILEGNFNNINVVFENQESARIMGEDILGRTEINADINESLSARFFTIDGKQEISLSQMPGTRAFHGEIVSNEEFLFCHADGTKIMVEASASPVYSDSGQIRATTVMFQDITEKKQI